LAGGDTERAKIHANGWLDWHPICCWPTRRRNSGAAPGRSRNSIVFVMVTDPVGVSSGLRGPAATSRDLAPSRVFDGRQWLQMLKELDPEIRRVSFIGNPQTTPYAQFLRSIESGFSRCRSSQRAFR
jgi:hypothetical protein